MNLRKLVFALAALVFSATSLGAGECACPGDCDADCAVSDADFAASMAALFDSETCPAADADADGRTTAADLLMVHVARIDPPPGCAIAPTPTATATKAVTFTPSPTASATSTDTAEPSSTPTQTRTPPPTSTFTLRPTATPTPTSVPTPQSRWIPLAPLPGGGRQEVGVTVLQDRVYVIGGLAPVASTRVDAYDTSSNSWVEIAPLPDPRHHVAAASLGGYVYAIGGFGGLFEPQADVYRYDPAADEWDAVASLPRPRGAAAAAVADGRIHVVGGDAEGRGLGVRDHSAYIPQENRWVDLNDYPLAREHISAANVDGTLYVAGGRSPLETDVHRWNDNSQVWIPLPPMSVARAGHAVAGYEGRLVVFGGEGRTSNANSDGVFPQVEVYDPGTNRWTRIDDMANPRHGIGAAVVGNRIYVPGGADVIGFGLVDTHDALEIDF